MGAAAHCIMQIFDKIQKQNSVANETAPLRLQNLENTLISLSNLNFSPAIFKKTGLMSPFYQDLGIYDNHGMS